MAEGLALHEDCKSRLTERERRVRFLPWRSSLYVICLSALQVFPCEAIDNSNKLSTDQFLQEATGRWSEYRGIIASHTQGTCDSEYFETLPAKKLVYHFIGSFVLNLDQQSVRFNIDTEGVPGKKPSASSLAFNPDYQFEVMSGRGEAWTISNVVNSPPRIPENLIGRQRNPSVLAGEFGALRVAMENACLGQMVYGAWLPLLVTAPSFELVEVNDVEDGLIKVQFKFEPERPDVGTPLRSGIVLLDPKRYWLIREVDADAFYPFGRGKLRIVNKFSEFSDGSQTVPYVSRQVIHVSCTSPTDGKVRKDEWIKNINVSAATDIDASQFTLTAFGLPEPQRSDRGQPWILWITIAVLGLSVSRLVYMRWSARYGQALS